LNISFSYIGDKGILSSLLMFLIAYLTIGYILANRLRNRIDITFNNGILVIKTKRFNATIRRIGAKWIRVLKVFSTASIPLVFVLMGLGVYILHDNLYKLLYRQSEASPFIPVIPGITLGIESLPYFAISVFIVLVSHELAHGIVATSERIPVVSSGFFIAFILFGGFVEPDEDKFNESSLLSKIRVLSVGSTSNYLIALIVSTLFSMLFIPAPGIIVEGTLEGYPAHGVLKPYDIIVSINGVPIENPKDLSKFMSQTKPGDAVEITVIRGDKKIKVILTLASDPRNSSKGFLGIRLSQRYSTRISLPLPLQTVTILSYHIQRLVLWIVMLCSSIAVINALPLYPFDGGQMLIWLLSSKLKNKNIVKSVSTVITLYFAALLIANIVLTFRLPSVRLWLP